MSLCLAHLIAITLCAASALAQDLRPAAPPQTTPILIEHATIHTVSGEVMEGASLSIEGGQIVTIAPAGVSLAFDNPPEVIDATGLHVYPGLISPYTQLGLTEIQAVRATIDHAEVGEMTPEVAAVTAVNPDSTLLAVTRANGILTAAVMPTASLRLSGSAPSGLIPGHASIIRLDGWTNDDLDVLTHAGLVINYPMTRPVRAWWMNEDDSSQASNIDRAVATLDAFFSSAVTYAALRGADPDHPTDLRFEAALRCLPGTEHQRPVFIQANDYDQIVAALAFAGRHGLRPVIVGGRDAHMCIDQLKAEEASVILVTSYRTPKRDDSPYDLNYTSCIALEEAGIPWTLATGDDTAHERNLPYAAAITVAHGLPPEAALRAVTLSAAQILGVGDRLGSIEPAKAATLLITDGHPLEVTTTIHHALIDGRVIDLRSKHTDLRDKYKEKYRQLGDLPRR